MDNWANIPRVPHATEQGTQEGRPHPALRRYQAHYGSVDWTDGLKLLAKRRSGEVPIIAGGLDDMSKDMALEGGMFNEQGKVTVNPKAPPEPSVKPKLQPEKEENPFGGATERYDPFNPSDQEDFVPPEAVMPPPSEEAEPQVAARKRPRRQKTAVVPVPPVAIPQASLASQRELEHVKAQLAEATKELAKYRDYLSARVRVEIMVENMAFNVPAVDVLESAWGVVVLLPTGGDAVTFTPAMGSEAVISCQKKRVVSVETIFTGTSFDMEAFGLFGLAFLKRDVKKDRPVPVQQPAGIPPSGGKDAGIGGAAGKGPLPETVPGGASIADISGFVLGDQ